MNRPPLSIVVPTRDRPEQLARCLASIRASTSEHDELIVVDSASRDADHIASIASGARARLIRCGQPGVNRARNAGWRAAAHALVAYVDDDVVVDDGWANAIAAAAAAQPQAAFITGRLSALAEGSHRHGDVAVKDSTERATLDATTRGDLGHGANLLVRVAALEAVDGWDESLGSGGRFGSAPEADLYDRLFLAGFTGLYEPAARAWHEQWRSPRELILLDWRYGSGNGARLSKLARTNRRRFRRVGSEALWSWGLQRLGSAVRDRNKTEAARVAARLAGTAAGFARGAVTRVRAGHFVEPDNTSS